MEDLLVCGSCQRDFPLGNIVNFVQHKKFDCADVSIAGLTCQSCPQQFGTPWSLMKHAQNVHALRIYLETGSREVNSYPVKWPVSSDISNNAVVDVSSVENISGKSSLEVLSSPQQPVALSGTVTVMLENSLSSELQAFPASNLDAAACSQFINSELMQSSLCSNFSENLENMSPKQYTEQKKFLSVDSNTSEHISGDLTLQAACTESSMEEMDSVSGHSAVLQKCCSSVLPKKRKRHMEIKHSSGRKRVPLVSSSPTSIYIDLEPGPEASYEVSHDTLSDPITVGESESSDIRQPSLRRRSVIIQPGMTFSIPLSHASVSLAPAFSYPIVADSVTSLYDQKSNAEQCLSSSNMVDSVPTAANTLTCQPVQELTVEQKSSADESSHSGLVGEEQGLAKAVEHKRRRYPTSRPFKCDQCDNAFNQRIHLKKHQSKHTGVKPFKCDQCDYSTVERSHLKVHIRVHTGEKPYKCTYCEYATAQNSTLKIHLRRHHHGPVGTESAHAAAAYVCSKCGVEFEEHDMYQCHDHDAEQHTSTMQSSVSVSSDVAFTDNDDNTDNVDNSS